MVRPRNVDLDASHGPRLLDHDVAGLGKGGGGAAVTAAELAAIEARMNRSYTEGIRQDGLELCAEVRRLTAEVARLSSALDAAARVVARKAARSIKIEDCRNCEALGYHGSNERCEAHR